MAVRQEAPPFPHGSPVHDALDKAGRAVRKHPIKAALAVGAAAAAIAAIPTLLARGTSSPAVAGELLQRPGISEPGTLPSQGVIVDQRPTGGAAGGGEGGLPVVLPSQPSTEGPPEEGLPEGEGGEGGGNGDGSQPPTSPEGNTPLSGGGSLEPPTQEPEPEPVAAGIGPEPEPLPPPRVAPPPPPTVAPAPAAQEEQNTGNTRVEKPPPFKPKWNKYAGDPPTSEADKALAEDMLNQYFVSMAALHPKLAATADAIKEGNRKGTIRLFIEDSGRKTGDRLRVVNSSIARQGGNRLFGLDVQLQAFKDPRNRPSEVDPNIDFYHAFRWIEKQRAMENPSAADDKRIADEAFADARALRAEILAGKR